MVSVFFAFVAGRTGLIRHVIFLGEELMMTDEWLIAEPLGRFSGLFLVAGFSRGVEMTFF